MLNKNRLPSIKLAHISLACVGLMWVLPFLYYHHAYPITTFYQEWGTALLGLSAMPLLLTRRYWEVPEVPRIVLLPVALMLLVMIQFILDRIVHFDRMMLLVLYLLFAAMLMMLAQRLRAELGLPTVVTVLAVFLLVGAELNTLAGVLQHYRWNTFLNPVITAKTSSAVYGNTAQPNHFANYIALGLISLGFLQMRFSLRPWLTALLALPPLFVLALSGSRSSWLYLFAVAVLAFLVQRKDRALRPLLFYAGALLLGFGLMHWVVELPWLQGATGSVTTMERLTGDNASGRIRLHLWKEAALIFGNYPLLGGGFGQFALEHLQLAAELRNPNIVGLYNNAHNIVMQLAAEGGLAGLAALLGFGALWLWQARKAALDLAHWWGYGVLGVLAIHSLLEYPLWYLYFIGVAAFLLGLYDQTNYQLELRRLGRLSLGAMLVLGLVSLAQLLPAYQRLEGVMLLRKQAASATEAVPRVQQELMALHQVPLLSSYAELFIASTMQVSADHLEQKLTLNERALRFIPISPGAYNQVQLLALSGREAEAMPLLEDAIWAYPTGYPVFRDSLEEMARKDPARFSALLEFATRKYKEYASVAVPAK